MRIYTKTGDKGETSLYGGQRVSKYSPRIDSIGHIDELNSNIGLIVAKLREKNFQGISELLVDIQSDLFVCGAEMATPKTAHKNLKRPTISKESVTRLEREIDFYSKELEPMKNFILPGGSETGALLHNARTICRRAERSVVFAMQSEEVNPDCQVYLNRLSDLLFTLARTANKGNRIPEHPWIT